MYKTVPLACSIFLENGFSFKIWELIYWNVAFLKMLKQNLVYCLSFASSFLWFCAAIHFLLDNMVVFVFSHLKIMCVFFPGEKSMLISLVFRENWHESAIRQVGMQHSLMSPNTCTIISCCFFKFSLARHELKFFWQLYLITCSVLFCFIPCYVHPTYSLMHSGKELYEFCLRIIDVSWLSSLWRFVFKSGFLIVSLILLSL